MANKICPECGIEQSDEFKYCKNCGTLLHSEKIDSQSINNNVLVNLKDDETYGTSGDVKVCPKCGVEYVMDVKFCRNCGTSLADEVDEGVLRCECGAVLKNEAFCPDCGKETGIKICPNCMHQTSNEDYCSNCGYKINQNIKICANCGSKIDARAKVCARCGGEVLHKNPFVAFFLSFIFPGLGQLYNHHNRKAVILIGAYIISFLLSLIIIGVILVILIWIYGMYDAFATAKSINNGEYVEDKIF